MTVFADSSALVTRYAPTEGDVLPNVESIVVSALARVEVASALWRKAALGFMSSAEAGALVGTFERDWAGVTPSRPRLRAVRIVDPLLVRAAQMTATHGLRSLDAIQLASALAARDAEPEVHTMVVLDERLRHAATIERFALLPR